MTSYCSNCTFFNAGDSACHLAAPSVNTAQHDSTYLWPRVKPTDWCGGWSTNSGYVGTAVCTWGAGAPTGGNNGDFYVQYIFSYDHFLLPITIYQNVSGSWTVIATISS